MKIRTINPTKTSVKKLKVAAYCRVSTNTFDQLKSLETQKEHYESFIQLRADWELVGIYSDSGITGTKADCRDGLQTMLADCRAGKIDRILVKSISRFSRNTADCLEIVRNLKEMGITVYFEKENVDTGNMDGELMLSLLSSLAEQESVSISQNEKWSILRRFQSGTYKMPYLAYGYKKDENGEMVVNPDEAEIVKFIFNSVIDGKSTYEIAKILHEKNVPTRKGGIWQSMTVVDIVSNDTYTGNMTFQKTYTDSHFRRHVNTGQADKFYIENHHEALVSQEIFDRANAIILQRSSEKGVVKNSEKYNKRYEFSGKIVCGNCGGNFKRRIHDRGSEIAWICKTHIENIEKCGMKYMRDDVLKCAFVTMLNKLIYSRKLLLLPYLKSLKLHCRNSDGIQKLQAELENCSQKIDVLRKLRAQNVIDSVLFNQEMNLLNKQTEEIRQKITFLNCENSEDSTKIAEAKKLLKFAENSGILTEYDADLFTEFAEKIIVHDRNKTNNYS